jgi:RsmE family RNA methyltransferase
LALQSLNILLLEEKVSFFDLPINGRQGLHITKVLKLEVGDAMDVGVQNGPKGRALLLEKPKDLLKFSVIWEENAKTDCYPVNLLVGLSRPQTCRKILEQATSMGVAEIHFFGCEKSEQSYINSRLWTTDEWERKIIKGAEQAFSTYIPRCKIWESFNDCLSEQEIDSKCMALDNYESKKILSSIEYNKLNNLTLAVGPERGWSNSERNLLRQKGYELFSIGPRVLRQETAVVASLSLFVSNHWEI